MRFRCISDVGLPIAATVLVAGLFAWPRQTFAQPPAPPGQEENVPPITVQIAPPPIAMYSSLLGVSSPIGAQSALGKPMFAEFVTEHQQSFADGNHISRSTKSSIYRDTQGRIRRESQLSVPGMPAGAVSATFITIVDHQLGYGFVLNPQEMVAHRYELNGNGPSYVARVNAQAKGSALLPASSQPEKEPDSSSHWSLHAFSSHHDHAPVPGPGNDQHGSGASSFLSQDSGAVSAPHTHIDQPFLAAPNPVRTENLGEQVILGFRARGTRVITTLPAGQIGNDRPIDIVSEQWFSPDLEMVLRSMHRDPWAGEFTTTVVKLSRGDQPTSLFEIPAAYKIIDAADEGEHHILDGPGGHFHGPGPW